MEFYKTRRLQPEDSDARLQLFVKAYVNICRGKYERDY
jgi:hypothetical protein